MEKLIELFNILKEILTVRHIMTPKDYFIFYQKGSLKAEIDLYPLKSREGNIHEYWDKRDQSLHKISQEELISENTSVIDLLELFTIRDYYFVISRNSIIGLVHYSDLNKRESYIAFYLYLLALETKLVSLLKDRIEDPLTILNQQRAEELKRRIGIDREKNVDVDPWEILYLNDIIELARHIGIKFLSNPVEIRKRLAHPSGISLINGKKSIKDLHKTIEEIRGFLKL